MGTLSDYEYENDFDDFDDDGSSAIPHTRSSLALTLLPHTSRPSQVSYSSSSRSSLGSVRAPDDVCVFMPPHRPMVGGGAAAAFEAARHDFYLSRHAERVQERHDEDDLAVPSENRPYRSQVIEDTYYNDENQSVGSNYSAPVYGVGGTPRNASNYEMLRQYHMSLLQRMQETSFILSHAHRQRMQEGELGAQHSPVSTIQPQYVDPTSPSAAITPIRDLSIPSSRHPDDITRTSRPRTIEDSGSQSEDEDTQGAPKRQRRN